MSFNLKTKARSWMVTIHENNMIKAGLSKEEYEKPEVVAKKFLDTWRNSAPSRSAGIVVCMSKTERYHAHMACYGNTTTLQRVAKILYDSHVEPQLGSKEQLLLYLNKEGKFEEKGEVILYREGLENVKNRKGERTDLEDIEAMLNRGMTPEEIFEENIEFRRFEKIVKSTFLAIRRKKTPQRKEMWREYHFGESGSGKTQFYLQLCDLFNEKEVYLMHDYPSRTLSGNLDMYSERCCSTLFIDEFRGGISYTDLLTILDVYSSAQIRCRYQNVYCLWDKVFLTSVLAPEEVYENMVSTENQKKDTIKQFMRRLDAIVYHFKTANGYYCAYVMPAEQYLNRVQIIKEANVFKKRVENGEEMQIMTSPLGIIGGVVLGKDKSKTPISVYYSDDF